MSRQTPAIAKAQHFVRTLLVASGQAAQRLPSVTVMAQQAGVSRMSMVRAVAFLRQQGLLETIYGKGVFPSGMVAQAEVSAPAAPADRLLKYEKTVQRIGEDIVSGYFVGGEKLAPAKQLCERYGCSAATLRKALRKALADGHITSCRRSFLVASSKIIARRNTIVHISLGDENNNCAFPSRLSYGNMINLEHECSRHGLNLQYIAYSAASDTLIGKGAFSSFPARISSQQTILGIVVWTMALTEEQLGSILGALRGMRTPVAIYDEMGIMANIPVSMRPAQHCVFAQQMSYRAGVTVGRSCLALGHKRIAYISLGKTEDSSDLRWLGLAQAYAERGTGFAAHFITGEGGRSARDNRVLTQRAQKLVGARLQTDMKSLLPNNRNRAALLGALNESVSLVYRQLWALSILIGKFEKALADDSLSAWVLFNDEVAVQALNFLESTGKQIPRDLSLVGFDNSELAYSNSLASYSFSNRQLASAMVNFLLGLEMPSTLKSSPHNVDIDGEVLNHGSLLHI